jgi:hypothetical protein
MMLYVMRLYNYQGKIFWIVHNVQLVVQKWVCWYRVSLVVWTRKKGNGLPYCTITNNKRWYIHPISITSSEYMYLLLILMTDTSVN